MTTTQEPSGLRVRKKQATRRRLQESAWRLAAESGWHHVTIEEIAASAGVSPRTFFNYFSGKQQALVGLDPELPERLATSLAARPAAEAPLTSLRAVNLEFAEELVGGRDLWPLMAEAIGSQPELVQAFRQASSEIDRRLTETLAARVGLDPDADLYPSLVVACTSAARRTALQHSVTSGRPDSFAKALETAFDLLSAGLPALPRR